tara:strand:- start:577 stop:1356 length:780 start_codon:yes stop_codon:yes gene_type:complete
MNSLPVVLLVGGSGSRMRSDLVDRPKHLVEIGGKAIVWHVMRLYSHFGHNKFILPLGHHGKAFRRYFLEYASLTQDLSFKLGEAQSAMNDSVIEKNWHVNLFDAGVGSSKGERIRLALDHISDKVFCVTYGDGIGDININEIVDFHNSHDSIATVTGYRPFSQYGVLEADDNGQVHSMHEKPRLDNWINAGFFVFDLEVIDYLNKNHDIDLETDIMPQLAADNELIMYRHNGFWASMDTLKDANYLNRVWNDNAPWKVW